ncbi:hypothetical protein GCM10010430_29030 [Kitasatospora cystarginea]|uniref:DNA phosphorothioation-associated protein 4 n=1 Tax=Kitasatospora cystarginea TaxID=58350 RepID=A0ABN3DZP9_9ACTN
MSGQVIVSDLRVNRPRDKEHLLQQLLASGDGVFSSMAEALLFAGSLGWSRGKSEAIKQSGEPIRYDVFRNMARAEAIIDAIAVLSCPGDALILSEDRTPERVEIFENYANGGLIILQGEIRSSHLTVSDTLIGLVRDAGLSDRGTSSGVPDDIRKLLASPE